ncbi:hypothetical protein FQ007_17555 [Escherichia coli]|nr:hypothetical protein [Escherichia coli]
MRKLNYHPSRHRTVFSANSSATPALRGNEVNMDFDAIMEKAYEEYFEGLAEGEEALSFSEFKQALSSSIKSNG